MPWCSDGDIQDWDRAQALRGTGLVPALAFVKQLYGDKVYKPCSSPMGSMQLIQALFWLCFCSSEGVGNPEPSRCAICSRTPDQEAHGIPMFSSQEEISGQKESIPSAQPQIVERAQMFCSLNIFEALEQTPNTYTHIHACTQTHIHTGTHIPARTQSQTHTQAEQLDEIHTP
jgi:hypothetical protein